MQILNKIVTIEIEEAFHKETILGKKLSNGTPFLLMEKQVNEADLTPCTWYGES